MEWWLIMLIAVMAINALGIIIFCSVKKFRDKMRRTEDEIVPPCSGVCVTSLRPIREDIDEDAPKDNGSQSSKQPEYVDKGPIIVDGNKLTDRSMEDGSCSSNHSSKTNDHGSFRKEISDNQIDNRDKKLLMFEAPPPYEESSKTASGTTRMVPMNMPQMDNTQATSGCYTPVKSAPQSANFIKRLIPVSPNKFADPRGGTAAFYRMSNSSETEPSGVSGVTPATMCRSEIGVEINGEDAGRTPRVMSPVTSGGSYGATDASTVVTFTPGSSTIGKED